MCSTHNAFGSRNWLDRNPSFPSSDMELFMGQYRGDSDRNGIAIGFLANRTGNRSNLFYWKNAQDAKIMKSTKEKNPERLL